MRLPVPDQLFAGMRMLALTEPGKFLFADRTCESIFRSEAPLPFPLNGIALRPITLFLRCEFFLVVALGLSCRSSEF